MSNLRGRLIRTGFGAKALGFKNNSMKSIAAAGAVLALATTGTVVVQTQTAPAAVAQQDQPAADAPAAGSGKDKAIYSPGKASQKGTISGSVKEIVEAKVGFGNVQASGKALKGVKVYAQWYEGENTQHSSPVYYVESDENGNFSINMAPYTDARGVTRTFEADASVGETIRQRDHKREKIRVWTELPADMTDKYRLVHQPAAGIFPGIGANTTPTTQGDGQWGGNKITGMTIQYAQKDKLPQHLPENKWAQNQGRNNNYGVYAGQTFWNLDVLQGALNHNTVSAFGGKDVPAAGLKVVGSYLNDQAVTKIEEYAKNNFAGKTLRGRGWTPADEAGLQKWINEQVVADPEGWIAETVHTTTAADGTFKLYWKGLYGNNHTGTGGGINPPADKLHKLAGSWSEGSWSNGNRESKHINMDWSYVAVYGADGKPLPDNIGALYPWALGQWAGPSSDGGNAQLFGGDGNKILYGDDVYANWNIALAPQALKFDVLDKNTTDNWATVGDKVQTDTAGLPIGDNLNYYIEWVDKNGKVVKTCETAKPDSATKIPSCELEVPKDAQTGDTFTARLKVADGDTDPKNDLVLAQDAFAVARDYLAYDPKDAKVDEEATSAPKFDNPATDAKEEKPEKAKFELGKLPEGVKEDQVKVDPNTGVVTFTPNTEQAGKTIDIPVVMRDEALRVPVLDENGDPVPGQTQGRFVARADATFTVEADKQNTLVEPKYEDKLVVPGQETKSSPTFTDKDGKDAKAPENSKFKITDGFTAPEGYEVTIDENSGEITVTFPDKSKLNKDTDEEFEVPVTVEYPDGSKDDAKAKFQLDTDGDGTPDTTDEDDDGDGVPDTEEIEKGTNPKDKNERPLTPIDPSEPTTGATVEPKYEDTLVVPGTDAKSTPSFVKEDEDGNPTEEKVDAPEGSKFKIADDFKAPEGYTVEIDESTGVVTVTADPKKLNKDTDEEFEVPVTVEYPDGSKDDAKAKFQLDTDGDGTPDTTDEDDDGDGVPDTEEIEKGTNPKDKNERPLTPIDPSEPTTGATVEPKYEDTLVVPGTDAKSTPSFVKEDEDGNPTEEKVDAPEGSKFKIADDFKAPEGYTVEIDESTGVVTVTADPKKLNKDTDEEFEVPVTVEYPDGSKDDAKAKFQLDTDGDGTPDTTDEDDDGDGVPDTEEIEKGTNPKDKNERPLTPIDPSEPTTGATVEPKYEDTLVVPGTDAKSTPSFVKEDEDGNPTEEKVDAPEGSKFKIADDFKAPEGYTVEIDESTGVVTVTADPKKLNKDTDEEFEVPVTVEYPDGSKDDAKAKFQLDTDGDGTPDTTDEDDDGDGVPDTEEIEKGTNPKDKNERPLTPIDPSTELPDWDDSSTTPDKPAEIPNTGGDVPADTTVEVTGPGTAEIKDDGTLVVTPTDEAKPGDKIVVVVTDPEGEIDKVTVTVDEPDAKNNETFEPEYNGGTGQPGEDVKIDAPTFKDGDKETTPPTGTTFTPGEGTPDGVTVDPNTGEITVTIPEDAKPGDKITVPVEVTYPDGTKDNVDVTVTVTEKDATPVTPVAPVENNPSLGASADDPASCELPPYVTVEKTEGVEYKVTVDGKELTPNAEGKYVYEYGQTVKVEATPAAGYTFPEGAQSTWTYTTKQNEVCEAPDTKQADEFTPGYEDGSGKPGEDVKVPAPEFKDKDGNPTTAPDGTTFKPGDNAPDGVTVDPNTGEITVKVPEDATPGDKITVPVVVTYPDGSTDTVDVTVTVEKPDAPADQPDWKDDKGKPGDEVKIPNTGGDVPDGTTVETDGPGKAKIDENGNLVVDIDKDAKPGDKITVVVKDKDGNEIDRVVVEVEKPDAPETEKPDWKDDSGKPGDKVEIPNTGGDVPEGTTVETDGPGKAKIDENGNLVVDIDKDAKPGDKITVVVKDKDGNEIDRVVVEVEKPRGPIGSLDDPNKIGAIIGGTIVGSGLIGALLGNHGDGAGSSAPGKPGEAKPGKPGESKPGAEKPGKGNAGNQGAGKGSTGAASQSTQAGSRGGSLAVTGVSGLAITLGASVIALALGGALMALRRRQS
ncbi:cell surface protein [Corynebacterium jeikeium]|uniref:Putative cell surface protein n=1 Tax=Corynebacterium jeikeium (strain K411) TaxID=306537 RepID=Q4JSJ3_CORJK|nr:YPDG domain-containing protein [Corynebacterium jeikeium]CAI38214.1 putative cell surface protein [Corynebacterium jeikeium K411]SUY84435.1 cell surface protein [Corynebacterium jeikeium]